jgi:hypothetical protein
VKITRTRLGWVFATGLAAAIAAACDSSTSESPTDAGAGDAAAQGTYCPSTSPNTLCADFSGDPATGWTTVLGDGGTLSTDTVRFLSPPAAAHFFATDVPAFEFPIRVLQKSFPAATAAKVHVELAVRVNSTSASPVGPKVLRTLFRDPAKTDRYEIGLYWATDAGIYLTESFFDEKQALIEAGTPPPFTVGAATPGTWHRFTLDLTFSGDTQTPGSGSFAFDDGPATPFTPPNEVQAFRTDPTFNVGLEGSQTAEAILDYDIDDVVIDVR